MIRNKDRTRARGDGVGAVRAVRSRDGCEGGGVGGGCEGGVLDEREQLGRKEGQGNNDRETQLTFQSHRAVAHSNLKMRAQNTSGSKRHHVKPHRAYRMLQSLNIAEVLFCKRQRLHPKFPKA